MIGLFSVRSILKKSLSFSMERKIDDIKASRINDKRCIESSFIYLVILQVLRRSNRQIGTRLKYLHFIGCSNIRNAFHWLKLFFDLKIQKISFLFPMAQAEAIRDHWDDFSTAYEAYNTRFTIQGARVLHENMQLETATSVLEIACASGIGTLDLLKYVQPTCSIVSTDYSTTMLAQAKKRLQGPLLQKAPQLQLKQANSEDLTEIATASMDRYVASLCLQLVNDPDAMLRESRRVLKKGGLAGFTIWGRPDHSLMFPPTHKNFEFGQDLDSVRQRFTTAGFDKIMIWPFMTISELWDPKSLLDMVDPINGEEEQTEERQLRLATMQKHLDDGKPLGLETYIIIATVSN